VTPPAPV
jgi:Ca2+-binding EF-hand superfamily protein